MSPTPRLEISVIVGQTWERFAATRLVVKEAEGAHSLAKVTFVVPDRLLGSVDLEEGSPVTVTWGDATRARTLHGYAHRVGVTSAATGEAFDLLVAGPSWPLKAGGFRSYRNRTATEILTAIAQEHGLSFSSDASFRVFEHFNHAGSDWEALRLLAEAAGVVLRCDDGAIRLLDPTAHMHRTSEFAALLTPTPGRSSTVSMTTEAADTPAAVAGFVSPHTARVQWVRDFQPGYVEPTEKFLAADSVPPSSSFRDAADTLAARRAANRFRFRAVGSNLSGDVRVKVAAPVVLDGFSDASSGTWSLREATHTVTPEDYAMDVVLGSFKEPAFYLPARTALSASGIVSPPMSLLNGRWVSEWR